METKLGEMWADVEIIELQKMLELVFLRLERLRPT
jgi:hypothetical protein